MNVRLLRALGVVVATCAMALAAAAPAHGVDAAGKSQPKRVTVKRGCKVLTRADFEAVLGGTATSQGDVRRGPDWLCRWDVGADGERPAGPVKVNVAFKYPPGACDALSNNPQYEVLDDPDGLRDALWEPSSGRLTLCKGKRVVAIQGVFNDVSVRPIRTYDAKAQFIALAALAQDRL